MVPGFFHPSNTIIVPDIVPDGALADGSSWKYNRNVVKVRAIGRAGGWWIGWRVVDGAWMIGRRWFAGGSLFWSENIPGKGGACA
ncbi:MAG: hypothetical protein Q4C47_09125 [Planctomycetia bacterium]|nr:hypothetical protein [Planctomycetia bacterium]